MIGGLAGGSLAPNRSYLKTIVQNDRINVICFSGHDWWYHNRAHSDIQLMTRIARERKVLFVNSIGMRMPMPGRSTLPWKRIFRKALSMLRFLRRPLPATPNFYVMTPVMIPLYGVPLLRKLNYTMIRVQVQTIARFLGIGAPHIFVTVPTAVEVCRNMKRKSLAYNRSDIHSAFGEVNADYIRQLENELLEDSDVVFYSSRSLMKAEERQSDSRAIFLDHGLDTDHFQPRPDRPQPKLPIRGKVIGFFGGLDDYVIDFDLLEKLAEAFPEATLLLVGDSTLSLERLSRYENVILTGFKPYEEIPAYGSLFDVAIMPWLDNDWIRHCNPIKMKEYLALNLEIVTTPFPEAYYYAEHLHIAETHEQFVSMVREVLENGPSKLDPEARRLLLNGADWDDRSVECLAQLDGVAEKQCAE